MIKLTPDCNEVTTLLWSPLHQIAISARKKAGVKAHLLICSNCRRYQTTFEWVLETLEKAPGAPALSVAYKMPIATKARLKTTIAEAGS